MKIAIFGSCVSRDTAEFIPDAEVVAYVARHSVTSLVTPHGVGGIDIGGLDSAFQRRMVTSDLKGNGMTRIVKHAKNLDLLLVDLVDERRGYWQFPDGTTMTNSIEIEACGAARDAHHAGAYLVKFGTGENFEKWKSGYAELKSGLSAAGLWERTILLDIEWAAALDGANHPRNDRLQVLGRRWRHFQRSIREAERGLSRGHSLREAWTGLRSVSPTMSEEFADRASEANFQYLRYRKVAQSQTAHTISRSSSGVRIDPDHRWGAQPFHYVRSNYQSVSREIVEIWRSSIA